MKHIIRTRSSKAAGLGRRAVGAALLASGLLLVSPALAGAQTDDTTSTTTTTEVDGTTSTTTTTVVDDTTSTTTTAAPDATPTTLPAVEPVAENITVVFTRDETPDPGCLVGLPRETVYIESTPEIFALKIVANAPLCNPIAAKAAIYGMPGNGEAWPQTLVETLPFTIQEAGTYEVTFTKTCDPVQFDVLSGATPEVIQPLGEWHGPLLYPLDVQTSQQHFGCEPDVQAATTIAPEVGGIAEVAPAELALTGNSNSTVATTTGAALLLAGALLLLAYRRRTT